MTTGATGHIRIDRAPDGTLSYAWEGGDTVWIAYELLRWMGIARPPSNTVFSFGPFTLRCTMHRMKEQVIEGVRIDHANHP
jgi:hypothetical protein